jgi:hypothetical protein
MCLSLVHRLSLFLSLGHVLLMLRSLELGGGAAAAPVRVHDGDFTKQLIDMEQQEQ